MPGSVLGARGTGAAGQTVRTVFKHRVLWQQDEVDPCIACIMIRIVFVIEAVSYCCEMDLKRQVPGAGWEI